MFKLILVLLFTHAAFAQEVGIIGKVESPPTCSSKAMVWVSLDKDDYQERLLLMHTLVPVGGKFQFYLLPGRYQIRASDEKGCEFFKRVEVKRGLASVTAKLEDK